MPDAAHFTETMSLYDARALLRKLVDEGHRCPLCQQMAKVYKRSINGNMANLLILEYRAHGLTWFHGGDATGDRTGDLAKLRYWGLIEEEIERRPDGGRSGWWCITPPGVDFIERRLSVPKYARVYDGRCLGHEGPLRSIVDSLGKRFDYDELMRR